MKTTKRNPKKVAYVRALNRRLVELISGEPRLNDRELLAVLSRADARRIFDLRGMEPGDVREFKIITEAVKKRTRAS